MAICDYYNKEMTTAWGCTFPFYDDFGDGITYYRVISNEDCHDCGVMLNELHHPGCDAEECPKCGGQAIGCDCHDTCN